jgi:hypothetical protein
MAKAKSKKRSIKMATKKRTTTRRRKRSTSPAKRRTNRRKKKSLNDKFTLMGSVKNNLAGAAGGGIYTGISMGASMMKAPQWIRILMGIGGAFGAAALNAPNVGAGIMGAVTHDGLTLLAAKVLLNDMEDTEFVDADTLQETDMMDENGNTMMEDDDGVLYALNDDGDYEAVGDAYALQEAADLNSVSMLPLMDAYALQDGYMYALQ